MVCKVHFRSWNWAKAVTSKAGALIYIHASNLILMNSAAPKVNLNILFTVMGLLTIALGMWNKGHIWNFGRQSEMHNFIESPICMGRERVKNPTHPTQKPLKVLNKIIEIASHQSDVVFDPFMGVGSTGVSAVQLSRNFIGFEVNPEYFAVAKERIETANKNEIEGGPESKEESPPYS